MEIEIENRKKKKLIDRIEYFGKQTARWLRVIFVLIILILFFVLVVKPYYIEQKKINEMNENLNKSLLLNRTCLENMGKEICADYSGLKFIYIDEFNYKGTFNCFDKPKINITQEQLGKCSK